MSITKSMNHDNIIILEKDNCKEESKVSILCPNSFYGKDYFENDKDTILIL